MPLKNSLDYILIRLPQLLEGKAVILGVGNALRSDDGFGSRLAQDLKGKVSLKIWDAGASPENFLGAIIKEGPSTVLLVDAVDFGADAAQIRLFSQEDVKAKNFFITHDISLSLLFDFLEKSMQAELLLLAIQPKVIGFGEAMSPEIDNRFQELKHWFLARFPL